MEKNLFDEFDPVSAKAWKQQIQYELKGKDYNESLVWESPEGIKTKPFYHADDLENINLRPSGKLSWRIAQDIFVADSAKANEKARDALQRGAESLIFTVPSESVDLETLLRGIDLDAVPIHFSFQFLSTDYVKKAITLAGKATGNIHLHIDCIGKLARTGNWFLDREHDFDMIEDILAASKQNGTTDTLAIDASLYQNSGANSVQQLAYALAHANEYLNRYDPKSIGEITFKIAIGGTYFFEIAKIRALRKLWEALAAEYQVPTKCHILAIPSKRNKTLYAYNVNLLRSSTECMSAILGGADTVCNLPYDSMYHKDNEFAERIARNQLLILKEESFFDAIDNPADGSYYIESLTQQLADNALLLFKDIEANGGFLKQLKDHTIQRKIKESAAKEQHLFDTGKEILVGTNAYLNVADKMKDTMELYPFVKIKHCKTLIEPIIERRLAENVEKERLTGEGWKQ
ncbi:heterodimeric methylmalonyl-CoA mutase small subunit [Pricia antarctica]|uniref:Heterodimeric methylmalonyl-CoA mutase small subunit n=1 Tax=Pricia antarctica TaxID=641691 RepID=A0A1G6YNV0_9FLAO|nr:methylmalonyl-CoA mutase subunit beta [Pricia antarctica]SDD91990.1 heterodimeric methylmalonyl-CoA mutase small subunit [Pricia antarctica]